MSSRRNEIVTEITKLEESIKTSNEKIALLKDELTSTPPDLLDRDPEAMKNEAIEQKNTFLRSAGLLP